MSSETTALSVGLTAEVIFVKGLAPVVHDEIHDLGVRSRVEESTDRALRLRLSRSAATRLLQLRTASAVFVCRDYRVARPKALLADETVRDLTGHVLDAISIAKLDTTAPTFRLRAAGRDTTTMRRLAAEISRRTGLVHDDDTGSLLIRVIPRPNGFWSVLVSLTPVPLSTRPWRIATVPGALDPTVAAALVRLAGPGRFLDLACGPTTILLERLAQTEPSVAVGIDRDHNALGVAAANLVAAGPSIGCLARMDAAALALRDNSFEAVCTNPPWGHQVGTRGANQRLYPALLREVHRITTKDAQLVVITHDIRQFERALAEVDLWTITERLTLELRGHHPHVWKLSRKSPAP